MGGDKDNALILWFDEIGLDDLQYVGGKCSSLGEMYSNLTEQGVNVPFGFAITATAYQKFTQETGIEDKIKKILGQLNPDDLESLKATGKKIRELIIETDFSPELNEAITNAYTKLCDFYEEKNTDTAVRSSATAEDLPDASFAGQQDTYLNIRGANQVLLATKNCFASLFTDRAIKYRIDKNFDHFGVYISVGIQKMVRSDMASSGVMFTVDTETGFKDVVSIDAAYGLGENVVQGAVIPDEYLVYKPNLEKGFKPIISKKMGSKRIKMVYTDNPLTPTKNIVVHDKDRNRFVLTDEEILKLADWGRLIEKYYSKKNGKHTPMDIEWAKDGNIDRLFVVQARPETVVSQRAATIIKRYTLDESKKAPLLTSGIAIGDKIGNGTAVIINDSNDMGEFKKGDILVAKTTDPDYEPIMKLASAIVTDTGGRKSHTAIVARELGIPCIAGTGDATGLIQTGKEITVCCNQGETGSVYSGIIDYSVDEIDISQVAETKTKILLDISTGDSAFKWAGYPSDGVGIVRIEDLLSEKIGTHPLALQEFEDLVFDNEFKDLILKIQAKTMGYDDKREFFIQKVSRHVGRIAAAFFPNEVCVRFSDYTSTDFKNLIGGDIYEPDEVNPFLGYRGAARLNYFDFSEAFELECEAIRRVREDMGLSNVKVAIPFVRTIKEANRILKKMSKFKLEQGKNGLEVKIVIDTPSNVMLIDEYSSMFDGILVNTFNLTQLTLGVYRYSIKTSRIFDIMEQSVLKMLTLAIDGAKKAGQNVNIVGENKTFGKYLLETPDFIDFMVNSKADSITVIPEDFIDVKLNISRAEK